MRMGFEPMDWALLLFGILNIMIVPFNTTWFSYAINMPLSIASFVVLADDLRFRSRLGK